MTNRITQQPLTESSEINLNAEISHHRFDLARTWIDCFQRDHENDFRFPKEQLLCGAMEVIDEMIHEPSEEKAVHHQAVGPEKRQGDGDQLISMLREVGLSHHEELLDCLCLNEQDCKPEFVRRCRCLRSN